MNWGFNNRLRQTSVPKSSPEETNILQMMVANEEAVSRLYEVYGSMFPEHEEFWFGLAMEEADHASWILELLHKVSKGSASIYKDICSVSRTYKRLIIT